MHLDNLRLCLRRNGLYAPNHSPNDGETYRTIHSVEIQANRHIRTLPCGPCGVIHDYVPFYFGYLSPMMFQLKTGRVAGYNEGQEPLIYVVSTIQQIQESQLRFVFSDGHGLGSVTEWFDSLDQLDNVDWDMVCQRYWSDKINDMDRQRRKQAEFLIHRQCPWTVIQEIAVHNAEIKRKVEEIMGE
ncbi:MAG TPA: DUF4433 domain-containing protein, partial [Tepidisphaeraceae bacterium]